ncbi:MAG: SDR family oxidoreductase [Gammaproteobacteria bacterium]|nr:SDR family oxidoreductase [Gammaproteobacteria bacterium]
MNTLRLQGRKAVVTGASSGIGRAMSLALAAEGCDVVINYRTSARRAEDVVEEIRSAGRRAFAVAADVGDSEGIAELVRRAREHLGVPDIWINNAGADILTGDGARDDDRAKLRRLLEVDLKGAMECCWAIAPDMVAAGRGVILNMSWDLALTGLPGRNPQMFAAVKAGVLGFSRALALELAPKVRVNVLAPGWIRTAFADGVMAPEYFEQRRREIPLGRFGLAEEVAAAAVFLVSDDAAYITGQVLNINGGLV